MKPTSETYTVAQLYGFNETKQIVLKYLEPLGVELNSIPYMQGTLHDFMRNMGGGIPYFQLMKFIKEIDSIDASLVDERIDF